MMFEFLDYDMNPTTAAPTYFGFECPKRAGHMCTGLIIRGNPSNVTRENSTWAWDGNREAPTFTPSINCKHCSHGFIEHGVWRDA